MAVKVFCDGCKEEIKNVAYRLEMREGNRCMFVSDLCQKCYSKVYDIAR